MKKQIWIDNKKRVRVDSSTLTELNKIKATNSDFQRLTMQEFIRCIIKTYSYKYWLGVEVKPKDIEYLIEKFILLYPQKSMICEYLKEMNSNV